MSHLIKINKEGEIKSITVNMNDVTFFLNI
jgi:hypothetical protein